MQYALCTIIMSLVFWNSHQAFCQTQHSQQNLDTLLSWMTGSFSSEEQSLQDTNYRDVRLQMVRIWEKRDGGFWLYVEQALGSRLDKPYRQRIYHLFPANDSTFQSDVYLIRNLLRFSAAPKSGRPLDILTPDSLELREGCSTILRWDTSGYFFGGTREKSCPSEIRGAVYATSQVTIERSRFISWDRGFDSAGKQVWGAEKGPYIFIKLP